MDNKIEKLIKAYERQPIIYKKILQLKSLFTSESKTDFLECIKTSNIKPTPQKNFNSTSLKTIYAILDNEGLLENGILINSQLRHHIAKEAVQVKGYIKKIVEKEALFDVETEIEEESITDIVKNYISKLEHQNKHVNIYTFNKYEQVLKKAFIQKIFLAVYENDSAFFENYFNTDSKDDLDEENENRTPEDLLEDIRSSLGGSYQPSKRERFVHLCNTFLNFFIKFNTLDNNWCKSRNEYIKLLFSLTCFSPIAGVSNIKMKDFSIWSNIYINDKSIHNTYIDKSILSYFICFDLVFGIFSREKYDKISKTNCNILFSSGLDNFLNGNFPEASDSLTNSLKQTRKKEGNGYISNTLGIKILFLLYLSNTTTVSKAKTEINKFIRKFEELSSENHLWNILLKLQEGDFKEAQNSFWLCRDNFSSEYEVSKYMLYLILDYLLNERQVSISIKKHIKQFEKFNNSGLLFHAHLKAELILKFDSDNTECKNFLKNISPYKNFRILSLFKKKEAWEYKLELLTKLISTTKKNTKRVNTEQKRIVWKLNVKELDIIPTEQKVLKNGNWSKGRNIALSRLYNKDTKLDYFNERDWNIARSVKLYNNSWYYGAGKEYYFDESKALEAMIGHPLIFNEENGLNIEIVKGNIEIIVKEYKDGYKILLSNYHDEVEPLLIKETETRYKFVDFDQNTVDAAALVTKKGLTVPSEKKEQIKDIQRNLKSAYTLNSNIEDKSIPFLNTDSSIILHFIPINSGLKVNLWVRPFDGKGPYLRPGYGEVIQTALLHNKSEYETRYKVKRNLSEEKLNAAALLNKIQYLQDSNSNTDEWILEEAADCMELLEQVKEYKEDHELLVEWPKGESLKLQQTVSHNNLKIRIQSKNDWFEFDGDIKLDDGTVVKLKYLLDNFSSMERRFIKLSDGKFLGLTEKLKKHLEELKSIAEKNRIHYLGTCSLQKIEEEGADFDFDEQWKKHIENVNKLKKHKPKIPKTLSAELRDYQKDGYFFLSRLAHWGVGGCLADDMGLGKTIQSITLLLEKAQFGPSLVVAPTSVCFTWIDEFTKFAPTLNIHYFPEADDREKLVKSLKKRDVLICSYGLMQINKEILTTKKWQIVLLDEAQAIKNPNTKRWKAAVELSSNCRFALTGTPIENHLGELWSIFRFLNPGQLGSLKSFQNRFITPIENNRNAFEKKILKNLMSPFILRRIKTNVLDELPPKTEQNIYIEISDKEKAFYEACRQQAVENIESISESESNNKRFSVLAEITKLRQACCHSSLVNEEINIENSKLKTFFQTVEKLIDNNHRALVFSQYVRFLNIIKKSLDDRNISYQYIDGSTKPTERKKAVDNFQAGESDLFLLSLKAGGTGLNLTAADYVIHLDPWWNPAVEDQASDRAHRIGQERPVTVYRLIMKNTIEEKIIKLHKDKRNLADDILGGTDIASRISEDELIKLIKG